MTLDLLCAFLAIGSVESGLKPYAHNHDENACGILQITAVVCVETGLPIGLRGSLRGSFMIMQVHFENNKVTTIAEASKLWNPKAPQDYHDRIANLYECYLKGDMNNEERAIYSLLQYD